MKAREDALALDAADPLAPLREQFVMPDGLIYLDGNSLGMLPRATASRLDEVIRLQWGQRLIRSWNTAGWMSLAQRVGDKIATLIGAGPGEVIVADSTSLNLFKVLSAALRLQGADASFPERGTPPRHSPRVVLSEPDNFPTDLYMAQSIGQAYGVGLELQPGEALMGRLQQAAPAAVAVLMLTHVNYRTGRMHDMQALTQAAHAAGALVVWDLAHSAGAVPVDLRGCDADFAVGCGYKYLNGGPGAPSFVWVNPRHVDRAQQPLSGWIGHATPFEFSPDYRPAAGIAQYQCGTPPILSLAALECGVDTVLAAEALGGLPALRRKSLALTRAFAEGVQQRCAGHGLRLASPTDDAWRGSQVCLTRDEGAYAIVQALIEREVIGDFRAPDVLRFGFTPLTLRYIDVWDAVEHLREVLLTQAWREARFQQRQAVT